MTDLQPPHPDQRAECHVCGAIVRWRIRGRHLRHHDWEDDLHRRIEALEAGGEAELLAFGEDGEEPSDAIEPDPDEVPDGATVREPTYS